MNPGDKSTDKDSVIRKLSSKVKDLENKLYKLIKLIHEDSSLLRQISSKQQLYSDKSVYENLDKELKLTIIKNEKYKNRTKRNNSLRRDRWNRDEWTSSSDENHGF